LSSSDDRIYETKFGPIDSKTRKAMAYLILLIFIILAMGLAFGAMSDPWLWNHPDPSTRTFNHFMLVIIVVFIIGLPLIIFNDVFFGKKGQISYEAIGKPPSVPREEKTFWQTIRRRKPSEKPLYWTERPFEAGEGGTAQVLQTEPSAETEAKAKQKVADYSYKGEMPRRKRRDEDIGK